MKDWLERARRVEQRHRYPCTDTDIHCNYQETHWHGVACDHTCPCKTM